MTLNPSNYSSRSHETPQDESLRQQISHLETLYAECLQANVDALTLNEIYKQIKTLRFGSDGQSAPAVLDAQR